MWVGGSPVPTRCADASQFLDNGNCGYVLKPEWMRKPAAQLPDPPARTLVVHVYSAHKYQGNSICCFRDDTFVKVWRRPGLWPSELAPAPRPATAQRRRVVSTPHLRAAERLRILQSSRTAHHSTAREPAARVLRRVLPADDGVRHARGQRAQVHQGHRQQRAACGGAGL